MSFVAKKYKTKPTKIHPWSKSKLQLTKEVQTKEREGWECVVPIRKMKNPYNGEVYFQTEMKYIK